MSWITISLRLCIYGVLKEFRPSESYFIPFLLSPRMNFTEEQVNNKILPIGVYASMTSMIFVSLTTDWLRYKIVIVFQALCGVFIYLLLSLCTSFTSIVIVEIFYGVFVATDVAYYTYTYSIVDIEYYQKITSYTRAANLLGRFFSGFLAQIFISSELVDTYQLNFFTLGSLIVATICTLVLPTVKKKDPTLELQKINVIDTTTETNNECENVKSIEHTIENQTMSWKYIKSRCSEFKNIYVLKWSFWVITATCSFHQVTYYIQSLWEILSRNECIHNDCKITSEWNGAVDAIQTIISTFVTLLCGSIKLNMNKYSNILIMIISILQCISLYSSTIYNSVYISYINFIIYCSIYQGMMTIASSEIAKCIHKDKHGFIFGTNNFLAIFLQSLVTFFMNTIALSSTSIILFKMYAIFCLFIGTCYLFLTIKQLIRKS